MEKLFMKLTTIADNIIFVNTSYIIMIQPINEGKYKGLDKITISLSNGRESYIVKSMEKVNL